MRTSIRSGALIGGALSIALCLLQPRVALAVVLGIVLAGPVAGLAVAKWLDLGNYGRQLEEGVRAGLLACGLPGFCALVSLLVLGPHDAVELAARSHAGGLSLAPVVEPLASFGWAGLDILFTLAATIAGVVAAAFCALIFAWSKSAKAAQAIRQARLTALALQRGEQWDALPPPGQPSVLSALTGSGVLPPIRAGAAAGLAAPDGAGLPPTFLSAAPAPSSQPAMSPGTLLWPAPASNPRATGAPVAASAPVSGQHEQQQVEAATPTEPVAAVAAPAGKRQRRKTSQARPVDTQLTDDVRKALAKWAEENAEGAAAGAARTPAASTYLNSPAPAAPKRNRKKNETRDWIC